MRFPCVFSIVLLIALFMTAPHPAASAPSQQEPDIRVDVKLVNVFATVTDANGAPVSTLTKDNFGLSEDGVPQSISVFSRSISLSASSMAFA